MATRKQVVNALRELHPSVTLNDRASPKSYCVEIEAPENHNWNGDIHAYVIDDGGYNKAKGGFWKDVLHFVNTLRATDIHRCSESDCGRHRAGCEWWHPSFQDVTVGPSLFTEK